MQWWISFIEGMLVEGGVAASDIIFFDSLFIRGKEFGIDWARFVKYWDASQRCLCHLIGTGSSFMISVLTWGPLVLLASAENGFPPSQKVLQIVVPTHPLWTSEQMVSLLLRAYDLNGIYTDIPWLTLPLCCCKLQVFKVCLRETALRSLPWGPIFFPIIHIKSWVCLRRHQLVPWRRNTSPDPLRECMGSGRILILRLLLPE